MELYVPRRVLRETARIVRAEALPNSEEILRKYYQLDPIDRGLLNRSQYQYKLYLLYGYLNNFHAYVPNDRPPFKSYYRWLYEQRDKLDVLHRDYDGTEQNSDLYLSQTCGEVLETIEAVFTHNNLPVGEINQLKSPGSFGFYLPMNRMGRLLFPSYVHLRALGYNHIDLAS